MIYLSKLSYKISLVQNEQNSKKKNASIDKLNYLHIVKKLNILGFMYTLL